MPRYHRKNIVTKEAGVSTYKGLDPLTGLAVYIYEFNAEVSPYLNKLESENISGILDVYKEGGKTQVVTAVSKGYQVLKTPLQIDTNLLLLDSARALRDAARLNIIHGDIRPKRFLATRRHLVIEGFGIPWQAKTSNYRPNGEPPSPQADVYAWARSILELTNSKLKPDIKELINSCVSAQAKSRPSAKKVYNSLVEILDRSKKSTLDTLELSPLGFEEIQEEHTDFGDNAGYLPISESNINADQKQADVIPNEPPSSRANKPETMPLNSKPGTGSSTARASFNTARTTRRAPNRTASSFGSSKQAKQTGFVKDLPAGSTYKKGDSFSKSKSKRNFLDEFDEIDNNSNNKKSGNRGKILTLLIILLIAASVGAFALFRQGDLLDNTPVVVQHYVVDVEIVPNNLPPVDVAVISSPAGSSLLPGTILQRVSGKESIALDKEGIWELQGRFQSSISDIVRFSLPEDRHVIITINPSTP